jgi:hypothetical protein
MTHQNISFAKSGLRIVGYAAILIGYSGIYYHIIYYPSTWWIVRGFVALLIAEIISIFEEFGEK